MSSALPLINIFVCTFREHNKTTCVGNFDVYLVLCSNIYEQKALSKSIVKVICVWNSWHYVLQNVQKHRCKYSSYIIQLSVWSIMKANFTALGTPRHNNNLVLESWHYNFSQVCNHIYFLHLITYIYWILNFNK